MAAYDEWNELCDEYGAANDAVNDALGKVNVKFRAIADGTGVENPSQAELDALTEAIEKREDVDRRMKAFIDANT
ncbi:hypothetical protein [Pandoraea communis]|uniref:hypothetical protein n=1 Tax=Pandoraea communis TaxID=2508297 RepID=UPI0012431028|nr:hypothetical protein [Pandoraea communis]